MTLETTKPQITEEVSTTSKRTSYSLKSIKKLDNEPDEIFAQRLLTIWTKANVKIPNKLKNVVLPENWDKNDIVNFLQLNPKLTFDDYKQYIDLF